jgi:indole-3-glycerol phosphate synthase
MNVPSVTPDLLAAIVAATRRIVEVRSSDVPIATLERRSAAAQPRGDQFETALTRADRVNVIAECKRRSPSRGLLRGNYDPASIARSYEAGGAAAISVLTEPTFFDGTLEHLSAVRAAVSRPVLRKDFIVDEYQLFEARVAGADAVLLIVAALDQSTLTRLLRRAGELALATLVEVHDEPELARAADAGARMIGVNNRNLRTLEVDVNAARRLAPVMPRGVIAVAESGLKTSSDLKDLRTLGYSAFLIGERLMASEDPGAAVRELCA